MSKKSATQEAAYWADLKAAECIKDRQLTMGKGYAERAKRLRAEDRWRREYERLLMALDASYGNVDTGSIRAMQAKIAKRRQRA